MVESFVTGGLLGFAAGAAIFLVLLVAIVLRSLRPLGWVLLVGVIALLTWRL